MSTPDITAAQIVAAISSVAGLFLSQGLISNGTEKVVAGIAAILIPVVWMAVDAHIRHGRATGPVPAAKK